jgi:uncharacterized DUF497 family protein
MISAAKSHRLTIPTAVVIATTETDEEIRVISMRKAERHEEEIYYGKL